MMTGDDMSVILVDTCLIGWTSPVGGPGGRQPEGSGRAVGRPAVGTTGRASPRSAVTAAGRAGVGSVRAFAASGAGLVLLKAVLDPCAQLVDVDGGAGQHLDGPRLRVRDDRREQVDAPDERSAAPGGP